MKVIEEESEVERWAAVQCLVYAGTHSASLIAILLKYLFNDHNPSKQEQTTQLLVQVSLQTVSHARAEALVMNTLVISRINGTHKHIHTYIHTYNIHTIYIHTYIQYTYIQYTYIHTYMHTYNIHTYIHAYIWLHLELSIYCNAFSKN